MKIILILSILLALDTPSTYLLQGVLPNPSFVVLSSPQTSARADQVLGKWMSEGKDLGVEVFKVKDRYAARIVWFECDESTPRPMAAHRDLENPDPSLRKRSWLGMVVVNDLKFDRQENEWSGGNIYDPNTGRTFKSVARMVSPQEMVVRGYWGIEVFGKSLTFNRVEQ